MVLLLGLLLISSAACALSARSPRQAPNEVPIISFINENNHDGSYRYSYETGDGISVSEEGFLKNGGQGEGAQSASGSYSYPAPDGQLIRVTWYADETGFHAEGDHIPRAGVASTPAMPTSQTDFPKRPVLTPYSPKSKPHPTVTEEPLFLYHAPPDVVRPHG